jgi:hypothetical protein
VVETPAETSLRRWRWRSVPAWHIRIDQDLRDGRSAAGGQVDHDRESGLWVAHCAATGEGDASAEVCIVHLDAYGEKQSEWRYTGE